MTSYNFQGLLVDVKSTNWHMSAKPDTTLNNNYDTVATTIPVGGIVMPGTVAGSIDNATTGITTYLGVATETRNAADTRPLTYTWAGVVRVITDNSAIVVGCHIGAGAEGKVILCSDADIANHKIAFGRALEANGSIDETIIMCYINMAH